MFNYFEKQDCVKYISTIFSSKVICEKVDITEQQLFLFDLTWKAQDATKGT